MTYSIRHDDGNARPGGDAPGTAGQRRRRMVARLASVGALGLLLWGPVGSVAVAQQPSPAPPLDGPTPTVSSEAAGTERVPETRPLIKPSDPVAAQAWTVLETHCARCHQSGRLTRAAPASGFGNILRLDEIAADPVVVAARQPRRLPPLYADVAAANAVRCLPREHRRGRAHRRPDGCGPDLDHRSAADARLSRPPAGQPRSHCGRTDASGGDARCQRLPLSLCLDCSPLQRLPG